MAPEIDVEQGWKRDEPPYLIFCCSKCKQYRYVKTIQKTSKCLRCGRVHQIKNFIASGEIIEGMTAALERVKELQNKFAHKKLGGNPDFVSEGEFAVVGTITPSVKSIKKILPKNPEEDEENYYPRFLKMLSEIRGQYLEFPAYILRMMAPEFDIPYTKIIALKNKALKEGKLKLGLNDYFKIP